jgi:hypothetical protein
VVSASKYPLGLQATLATIARRPRAFGSLVRRLWSGVVCVREEEEDKEETKAEAEKKTSRVGQGFSGGLRHVDRWYATCRVSAAAPAWRLYSRHAKGMRESSLTGVVPLKRTSTSTRTHQLLENATAPVQSV